jgi:hypothetical protein
MPIICKFVTNFNIAGLFRGVVSDSGNGVMVGQTVSSFDIFHSVRHY